MSEFVAYITVESPMAKAEAAWHAHERWIAKFASAYRAQADEVAATNTDVAWARLDDFGTLFDTLSPLDQHTVEVLTTPRTEKVAVSEFARMVAASSAANARVFG